MAEKHTFTIDMTYKALMNFVLKSYYTKFSGISTLFLGAFGIFGMIYSIAKEKTNQTIICYALVGVICLILNPIMLMYKAKIQLKQNPSYKKPIKYEIDAAGLSLEQGEAKEFVAWKNVHKISMTKNMIAIYTSPYHAFVWPVTELKDKKDEIVKDMVSFAEPFKVRMSKSLKTV